MAARKSQEKIEQMLEAMLAKGWRPNTKWLRSDDLRTLISGELYGDLHWVSPDEHYTMRVKSNVLTVHDAQRQYCKVISMKLNELEVFPDYIKCGQIGLFL